MASPYAVFVLQVLFQVTTELVIFIIGSPQLFLIVSMFCVTMIYNRHPTFQILSLSEPQLRGMEVSFHICNDGSI